MVQRVFHLQGKVAALIICGGLSLYC